MQSRSHAFIRPHAPSVRLRSLIGELRDHGCRFPLTQRAGRLDFDLAECTLAWCADGGLEELFGRYADVALRCPDLHGRPVG